MSVRSDKVLSDDGLDLQAEMDAIASMTLEEVHAGLRQFGVPPINDLPEKFRRLLAAESLERTRAQGKPRFHSAVTSLASLFALLGERLAPYATALLVSCAAAIVYSFLI